MTESTILRQKRAEHLKRSRFRFWLQVLLMAAGMSLLWSMVPYSLILTPPRASTGGLPPRMTLESIETAEAVLSGESPTPSMKKSAVSSDRERRKRKSAN